jgi:UDP-glucuronate 4-epimerase
VLEIIGRVTGKRLQLVVDPVQKGDMRHTYADTSLARAELGYRPAVRLEQGLAAEFRWLSEVLAS